MSDRNETNPIRPLVSYVTGNRECDPNSQITQCLEGLTAEPLPAVVNFTF